MAAKSQHREAGRVASPNATRTHLHVLLLLACALVSSAAGPLDGDQVRGDLSRIDHSQFDVNGREQSSLHPTESYERRDKRSAHQVYICRIKKKRGRNSTKLLVPHLDPKCLATAADGRRFPIARIQCNDDDNLDALRGTGPLDGRPTQQLDWTMIQHIENSLCLFKDRFVMPEVKAEIGRTMAADTARTPFVSLRGVDIDELYVDADHSYRAAGIRTTTAKAIEFHERLTSCSQIDQNVGGCCTLQWPPLHTDSTRRITGWMEGVRIRKSGQYSVQGTTGVRSRNGTALVTFSLYVIRERRRMETIKQFYSILQSEFPSSIHIIGTVSLQTGDYVSAIVTPKYGKEVILLDGMVSTDLTISLLHDSPKDWASCSSVQ